MAENGGGHTLEQGPQIVSRVWPSSQERQIPGGDPDTDQNCPQLAVSLTEAFIFMRNGQKTLLSNIKSIERIWHQNPSVRTLWSVYDRQIYRCTKV